MALPMLLKARRYQWREVPCGRYRGGGVLACDTFQRANSTTLGSTNSLPYLPGIPGIAWSEVAGNWEINTNRLGSEGASPGGQGWLVTLDLGVSDYEISWTISYTPDGNNNGLIVAYVDGTNFIRMTLTSTAIQFVRVTSGTPTNIGTGQTLAAALGDTLVISKASNVYAARVIRAGAQVGSTASATENQGSSSTVIGIRAATASVRFTNFVARRAA